MNHLMNHRSLGVAWLLVAAAGILTAQTTSASLAGLVISETSALNSSPDLSSWRKLHPGERLRKAAYGLEYETQGLWCAASVADTLLPGGSAPGGIKVTRHAFFYVPPAALSDPLPENQDSGLIDKCRLLSLWYEVTSPFDPTFAKIVSADFATSFGPAAEPPSFKRTDMDWGSGYWNPYWVWERAKLRIVLAVDPGGPVPAPSAPGRLLVIARTAQAPRGLSLDWTGGAPKGQPRLEDAAEITRFARFERPCAFEDGHNNWQPGLIRFGEKLLQDFPASPRRAFVHLTLARALAARLILTYPDVERSGANRPANPEALRRDAITHFRAFLEGAPLSPEADSARREAWRLLAGLPPSPIHFGCSD